MSVRDTLSRCLLASALIAAVGCGDAPPSAEKRPPPVAPASPSDNDLPRPPPLREPPP
jgi:hypothetical protein